MSLHKMTTISRHFCRSGLATGAFSRCGPLAQPHRQNAFRLMSNATTSGYRYKRNNLLKLAAAGVVGITATSWYNSRQEKKKENVLNFADSADYTVVDRIPDVPIARKIVSPTDKSGLDLVLFQYQTCPFCCKVRAFLDYHGLTYSVVEVDSVLRQSLKWSPYRKVPSLLVRKKDGTYVQLIESSMIVSALSTYLDNPSIDVGELVKSYPIIWYRDEGGNKKCDVSNKYSRMRPDRFTKEFLDEERQWRAWTDDHFIHLISPNVYRTFDEALETFNWFSEAGEWDKLFPSWERNLMIYVGAVAMYLIGKRLKKKHRLDGDEREYLYSACKKWTNALKKKNAPFMGGASPNLADLAFYGALTCMEGCHAFDDIRKHTNIATWFDAMKKLVNVNRGSVTQPANVA